MGKERAAVSKWCQHLTRLLLFSAVFIALAAAPALAVYHQPLQIDSAEGEDIPRSSISFRTTDGEAIPVVVATPAEGGQTDKAGEEAGSTAEAKGEDDDDEALGFWLLFPGDEPRAGTLTIDRPGGAIEVAVPAAAAGEKVVVDLAKATAIALPFNPASMGPPGVDMASHLRPIEVGPKAEVGTPGLAEQLTGKSASSLLGGLGGGSGGLTIGSGGGRAQRTSTVKEPRTVRDPTAGQRAVRLADTPSDTAIESRAMWTDDGLLVSTYLDDSEDDGTFHYVYLVDENGRELAPSNVAIYEIWQEITLTVTWTRREYVNGELVRETSGGWSESWTESLGRFTRAGTAGAEQMPGLWQQLGYERGHAGMRRIGTTFKLTPEELAALGAVHLVVHVTRPSQDPVTTVPFGLTLSPATEGVALAPYAG